MPIILETVLGVKGPGSRRLVATGEEATKAIRDLTEFSGARAVTEERVILPVDPRLVEFLIGTDLAKLDSAALTWYTARVAPELRQIQRASRDDATLPHPSAVSLKPYQRVGADFMAYLGKSLLCDEMGLGKTVTSLVALELAKWHLKVLVVCPNGVRAWWAQERARWTFLPSEPVVLLTHKDLESQLKNFTRGWVIVNYQVFRMDDVYPQLQRHLWDWVVFDEAHILNNRKTDTYKKVEKLVYRRAALLTGSPYGNNVAELWALLHLTAPEAFSSYWRFWDLFVDCKETAKGREILGVKNPELFRRAVLPYMIRRSKEDVHLQLPPKVYQTFELEMTDYQEMQYRGMARRGLLEVGEGQTIYITNVLALMTRQRQILSTPATLGLKDDSCKLDAAMDIIQGTEDRVVVFAMFRHTVAAMCRRLEAAEISYDFLMGGVSSIKVMEIVEKLNTGKIRVVVATLQTGGVGLNLIGASVVIFIDKHYNPVKQQQAEDRVHRIGQTKTPHIITLTVPGTIDDVVEGILAKKIGMQEALLSKYILEDLHRWAEVKPCTSYSVSSGFTIG